MDEHAEGPRDEDLVTRMRAGDTDAGRLLYERHRERLRARVRRRLPGELRGKVGPSDVLQEAWIATHLALAEFEDRGDGSFARWLDVILERKVLDEVRRHMGAEMRDARREAPLPASTAGGVRAGGPSPSSAAIAAERQKMLSEQVARLPEDHRTILRLVHDEGLTLVAAGARMGRSPDAARKLYGRALAGLTERLLARRDDL